MPPFFQLLKDTEDNLIFAAVHLLPGITKVCILFISPVFIGRERTESPFSSETDDGNGYANDVILKDKTPYKIACNNAKDLLNCFIGTPFYSSPLNTTP